MEPGKNAQHANFHGSGRHDLHTPQAGIVYRCNVRRPYRPAGRDQASDALLSANAQEMTTAAGFRGRLCARTVRGWRIQIAVASLVQVDVIALIWLRHCSSRVPQAWLEPRRYVGNFVGGWKRLGRRSRALAGWNPRFYAMSFRTGAEGQVTNLLSCPRMIYTLDRTSR